MDVAVESVLAGFHAEVIQMVWEKMLASKTKMSKDTLKVLRSQMEEEILAGASAELPKKRRKPQVVASSSSEDGVSSNSELNDLASAYFVE